MMRIDNVEFSTSLRSELPGDPRKWRSLNKEEVVSAALRGPEGWIALAQAMIEPLKITLEYQSPLRKALLSKDGLPLHESLPGRQRYQWLMGTVRPVENPRAAIRMDYSTAVFNAAVSTAPSLMNTVNLRFQKEFLCLEQDILLALSWSLIQEDRTKQIAKTDASLEVIKQVAPGTAMVLGDRNTIFDNIGVNYSQRDELMSATLGTHPEDPTIKFVEAEMPGLMLLPEPHLMGRLYCQQPQIWVEKIDETLVWHASVEILPEIDIRHAKPFFLKFKDWS